MEGGERGETGGATALQVRAVEVVVSVSFPSLATDRDSAFPPSASSPWLISHHLLVSYTGNGEQGEKGQVTLMVVAGGRELLFAPPRASRPL